MERRLVRSLREADGERRNPDTARIEHLHRVDEAMAFLAEQVIGPQGLRPDEQTPPLSRGCWAP